MLNYLAGTAIGAVAGGMMGARGSCETGACPLTANPYRGAVYGALLGFLIMASLTGSTPASVAVGRAGEKEQKTMQATEKNTVIAIANKSEFNDVVLGAKVPVLVDLWATWCGPCRVQMPIVEQVAAQAGDRARVVKVNVDDAADLARDLGVESIPTLIVFKDGKEQKRFVGLQSADTLATALGL
jgi:thioredoxin 1